MTSKDKIKPASTGDPSLLVLSLPADVSGTGESQEVFALPLEFRYGGLLLALPAQSILNSVLELGQSGADELMFGPSSSFSVPLVEEQEDFSGAVSLGLEAQVLVVDVQDDALQSVREYDPVTDSLIDITGFSVDHPQSLPDFQALLPRVKAWLVQRTDDRSVFYSAQEDQTLPDGGTTPKAAGVPGAKRSAQKRVTNASLAEQLSTLVAQMQVLAQRQDRLEKAGASSAGDVPEPAHGRSAKLPAVSAGIPMNAGLSRSGVAKAVALIGPPPKVKAPAMPSFEEMPRDEPYDPLQPPVAEGSGIAAAIAQQSTAITALVAHLTQSGDVLGDPTSPGQLSTSTKGVQRRERMQSELAGGTSNYFHQMMQQLHRRVHPSKPIPSQEDELYSVSMLHYLERQGGFKSNRELGLIAWILGHAVDAAASGNFHHTKEIISLLMIAVEQACIDRGDWSLAYMLTLLEEPPLQVFQERAGSLNQHTRPFGPLVPPAWTAVCLSYLKDLEVLATKKTETAKKVAKPAASSSSDAPAGQQDQDKEASPKRKARFPRKPKAKASADA